MSRRDDKEEKTYFRSDRLFCSNGQWFFATREGDQGPFPSRDVAKAALDRFITEKTGLYEFEAQPDVAKPEVRKEEPRLTTIAKRLDKRGERVEARSNEQLDWLL